MQQLTPLTPTSQQGSTQPGAPQSGGNLTPQQLATLRNSPLLASEYQRVTGEDLPVQWPGSMETYLDLWQTPVPDSKAMQAARDRHFQALGFMARGLGGPTVAGVQTDQRAEAIARAAAAAGASGHPLARVGALQGQQDNLTAAWAAGLQQMGKEETARAAAYAKGFGGLRDIDQLAWRQRLARAEQDAKLRSQLVALGLKDLGQSYDAAMIRMKAPTTGGWWETWGPAIGGFTEGVGIASAAAASGDSQATSAGSGQPYYPSGKGKGWYDEPGAGGYY